MDKLSFTTRLRLQQQEAYLRRLVDIGAGYERRRGVPGNPFPKFSPWGRELDRLYEEDRLMRRMNRFLEIGGYPSDRRPV